MELITMTLSKMELITMTLSKMELITMTLSKMELLTMTLAKMELAKEHKAFYTKEFQVVMIVIQSHSNCG